MGVVTTPLGREIIGCAITVHRALGPGLFERVYEQCLLHEFSRRGLPYSRQVPLALTYADVEIQCAYRADVIVANEILIELKCIEWLLPVHHAQVMTYLRLSGLRQAMLINFNVPKLVDGLKSYLMS